MIYLDANSTSRLRPEAAKVIAALSDETGLRNPSSVHGLGRKARSRLTHSRRQILAALGFETKSPVKLIFTSGGTEACNMMVFGYLGNITQLAKMRGKILSSAIEHPAVLEPLEVLQQAGWEIRRIPPNSAGVVQVEDFENALDDKVALVTLMAANNETGALQPIIPLARALRQRGYAGPIVCDFTQVIGKSEMNAADLFVAGVNALAVSGHKIGAPAGIGALVISETVQAQCFSFEPLLRGGPQEFGFRAGTENVFGALTFGEVCESICKQGREGIAHRRKLRERLWLGLERIPEVERLTPEDFGGEASLSNTLLVAFAGCRGDDLVVALDLRGVALSTGSACASGKQGVSHVVTAMGRSSEQAREVVRFSLDWDCSEETVDLAISLVASCVANMREQWLTTQAAVS